MNNITTTIARAATLALLLMVAGCAAEKNFRRGEELQVANRSEEALAEYRQALQAEPTNARYRIAYLNARDRSVQQWIDEADRARRQGQAADLDRARSLYDRVLRLDENNGRAQAGMADLDRDLRHAEYLARARTEALQNNPDMAQSRLRWILSENPQHAGALALRSQLAEQRAKPRLNTATRLAEAFRKPVSLEFRDAQLKQVFEVLSRSSGLNFILDKDVRGDQRTTVFLRNSTIADAVALTLLTNQLDQRVLDGNTVLIFPNNPAKVREYQQLTVKSFVLASADAKTVANSLKTILKAKDVVIDEKQNMIIMRDSPEAVLMAEKLVALHDQPEAEVMLDVEILEIKRSRLTDLGVQYPSQVSFAPLTSATGGQLSVSDLRNLRSSTIGASVGSIGFQATTTNSDINVLANPRIRSRNREKAKVQVGQRVPNITSTSTSTGFVAETIQYVDVGLKLEVEPTVSPDGEVAIKVGLEVSNILRQVQTKGGSIAYEIGTRNANTVLRLRDGENQVLAGLINDEDRRSVTGLPGLAALPLAGGTLFGASQTDYQKSEIVLSITPRIIRPAFRPDLDMGEFESGTEANLRSKGIESGDASAGPQAGPARQPQPPQRQQAPQPATTPALPLPALPAPPPPQAAGSGPRALPEPEATPAEADTGPAPGEADVGVGGNGSEAIAPSRPLPAAGPAEPEPPATPEPEKAPAGPSDLSWRGASGVGVGGTMTVDLWLNASQALSVVPLNLNYDPRVLSVVSVEQGSFMGNAGTTATLSKKAEAGSGTIRAIVTAAGGTGTAAEGSMLQLVFKALAPSDGTRIALSGPVSAVTPMGESVMLPAPAEWMVRVK
jgi:general secretion pathway protein D